MNIEKGTRVLVISPHTDDAELGAGGTIASLLEKGCEVFWIVFSAAEDSLPAHYPKDTLRLEFEEVCNQYGIPKENRKVHDFQVRRLGEHRQRVLDELYLLKKNFQPQLVIGPSLKDFHQDHIVVASEMVRAFKGNASIICYELPWNHVEFTTQYFVRLERRHIEKKVQILSAYKSQKALGRYYFSENSVYGLAYTRGTQINHEFAESFEIVRWID
jgi:LmbE family N-acetylglucosaminyl deacetylase